MRQVIAKLLKKALKENKVDMGEQEIENLIEIPPSSELGDYAFPCFAIASKLRRNPAEIAMELREDIQGYSEKEFEDVQTQGAYINFFLNKKNLAKGIIKEVLEKKKILEKAKKEKEKKRWWNFSLQIQTSPFILDI